MSDRLLLLATKVAALPAADLAEFKSHLATLWGDTGPDMLGVREPVAPSPPSLGGVQSEPLPERSTDDDTQIPQER